MAIIKIEGNFLGGVVQIRDKLYVKGWLKCKEIISKESIRVDGSIIVERIMSGVDILCLGNIEARYLISAGNKIISHASIICGGLIKAKTIRIGKNSDLLYKKLKGKVLRG